MTTYENAPATRLIATHCAVCHRALRDAVSVERGVGPDCAEKYGLGVAQGAADWFVVAIALAADDVATIPGFAAQDAQKLCNVLVHRIAAQPEQDERNGRYLAAIRAAGFTTLADRLAKNLKEWKQPMITVTYSDAGLILNIDNLSKPAFAAYRRTCQRVGARFDRELYASVLPAAAKGAFVTVLELELPEGEAVTIRSEKGSLLVRGADAERRAHLLEKAAERAAIRAEPAAIRAEPAATGLRRADGRCARCAGHGHIPQFNHVEAGVCFRCGGSGEEPAAKRAA